MNKIFFLLLFLPCESFSCAVTYNLNGRRLGDNLLAFSNALWVSYTQDIPLLYRPFKNAEKLALSKINPPYEEKKFSSVLSFKEKGKKYDLSSLDTSGNILCRIPYFPFSERYFLRKKYFHFPINWKDPEFKALLRKNIQSIEPIEPLLLPLDRCAVAVHVRTGRGHDKTFQIRKEAERHEVLPERRNGKRIRYADKRLPHKFPPNSFFIEQIKVLSELLHNQPLYVHIFTDDPEPDYFCQLFKEAVDKPNIIYGFRKNAGLLEDFFALTQFAYFIRGESNFSLVAELLADAVITITPLEFAWKGRTLTVTHTETLFHTLT